MTRVSLISLVFASVLLALPGGSVPRRRLGIRATGSRREPPIPHVAHLAVPVVLVVVVVIAMGWRPIVVVLTSIGIVILSLGRRLRAASVRRRSRSARQRQVISVCDALIAELGAGLPAATALTRACRDQPELEPVVAAVELGGDVVETLRQCAAEEGGEGLRAVAAAWEIAGGSGAGLATVVDRVAIGLRHDQDARAEVQATLGAPRATARMLAVLPIFGLLLGASIGAEPLTFLLRTPWGLSCLAMGALLAVGGVWWVERLADAAEI